MKQFTATLTWLFLAGIGTSSTGALAGENMVYTVDGKAYEGYYAPVDESRGLVVIIHDWDGLTDYEVTRAGMLADMGYSVFAADLYGQGVRPTELADKRALTGALYGDRDKMRRLMQGALAAAASKGADADAAVVIGYCFGGTAVLELARSGEDLAGFVTFHGGLETPKGQDYSQTSGKVMVYHGSADQAVSMQQFADLAEQLEGQSVPHQMTTYSGAPHAFTVFGSARYHEVADRESWESFTDFLGETLSN